MERVGQAHVDDRHLARPSAAAPPRARLRERLAGQEFAPRARLAARARAGDGQARGLRARRSSSDLVEVDYGDYEGLTTPEIREHRPGWSLWTDGSPGGETVAEAGARADRVLERALAADGDVALFAHGHILRVLAARWLALPAERGASFALDTASLSELGFERENHVLSHWNSA